MDRLLDGLTEQQRLAVTTGASRLRILAGAGSGKTRVLTRRIAHQSQASALDPRHTLALTFTRKAAAELRSRLGSLGLYESVQAGTFHAHAYAQLRIFWADQGERAPKLTARRAGVVARVLPRSVSRPDRLALLGEIDWATARRIGPESYAAAAERAGRRIVVAPSQIADHYRAFVEEKRRRRLVDFDDLLELAIAAMADPVHARAQHWRFQYLFVDEFQDVNPLQYDLLRVWLGNDSTLCVVGDPNQAIYSWNGADAVYLERFDEHFPGAETVELRKNFRSTPQILAAATAIRGAAGRLEPTRPDGALPTIRAFEDGAAEAAGIARTVRDHHGPGKRWSHQAVLVRTNAQTATIVDAMHRADIPVSVRAGASVLDDARVRQRLTQIENDQRPLAALVTDLRVEAEAEVDDDAMLPPGDLAPAMAGALRTLAGDQFAVDGTASVADFVAWVRSTLGADVHPGERDAVDVVTFHAAKGLEWPVVHLAGIEEGLAPISHATTDAARDEERRLFYVAVTRAQDELHCSWARTRRFGQKVVERAPSVYLREIAPVAGGAALPDASAGRNLDMVRALREQLGVRDRPLTTDDDLAARLRSWRLATARASGVPAYVVFGDRTLDALVRVRPANAEDLHDIPGLGPVKIDRFGPGILETLREPSGESPRAT